MGVHNGRYLANTIERSVLGGNMDCRYCSNFIWLPVSLFYNVRSNVRKYFFNNKVVDAWNSLTNEIIISPSVIILTKRLYNVNLDSFLLVQ